ncbi:carbon-nitrogen hydrolase family protein [Clostridium polynesiense]|uniref:carbon-nitrogen hydrolase family protein n=1 Tax=Clostridium polynesiense TaxID=1325933 RepID=UPI00058CC68F|nr:carbon-nitrogen hydrolase family protein [Clostridium polynesiense]
MKSLKVGLIQHKAKANNINMNLELGLKYISEAKKLGADIVLFPEMWSNGYKPPYDDAFYNPFNEDYENERQKWLDEAIDEESSYVKSFKGIAKSLEIGIVITYLSKESTGPQNTALVIDKTGNILMKYSKVHTCDFSLEALLESGKEFKVCDFCGVKLGVMICYDREFPESARVLMLKGAEIILVPNACDMNPARINQLSTRAFENMVGIAMTNYPDNKWGNSCAFSPIVFDDDGNYIDNKIIMAGNIEEDILIAEFDLDSIKNYRNRETWGNAYRKVGAYKELLDDKVEAPFIRKNIKERNRIN